MREFRTYGSVRGALGNGRPYRDHSLLFSKNGAGGRGAVLTLSWDREPPFGGMEITRDPGSEDHPSQARFVGVGQAARQCQLSL